MSELEELKLKCTSYENIIEGIRLAYNPWMFLTRINCMMRTAVGDGVPVSVEKARDVFSEL